MGRRIIVIHYENLYTTELLKQTMKDVCKFLDFEFNDERFNCILKNPYDRFKRNNHCLKPLMSLNPSEVFHAKHRVLLDTAIDKIHNAMSSRGIMSNNIVKYKNTTIKLDIC